MNRSSINREVVLSELVQFCEQQLNVKQACSDVPLADLGIDSMDLLSLYAYLSKRLQVSFDEGSFDKSQSLSSLLDSAFSDRQRDDCRTLDLSVNSDRDSVNIDSGLIPTLANRYSYLSHRQRNFDDWVACCEPVVLESHFDDALLASALQYVVSRFDALRTEVVRDDEGMFLESVSESSGLENYFAIRCPSRVRAADFPVWISKTVGEFRAGMDMRRGKIRLLCIRGCPDSHDRLVLMIHHVAADGVSLRIVSNALFRYLSLGGCPDERPAPKYTAFATAYHEVNKARANEQYRYWNTLPWDAVGTSRLDIDVDHPDNIERYSSFVECESNIDVQSLMKDANVTLLDRMVVATGRAYQRVFGGRYCAIAVLHHGRKSYNGVGAAGTVGWISDVIPYVVDGFCSGREALEAAAAHGTRTGGTPGSFAYLKYFGTESISLRGVPRPQISLNYAPGSKYPYDYWGVGREDVPGMLQTRSAGSTQRVYLLSAGAWTQGDRVKLRWDYSSKLFDEDRIARFTRACLDELEAPAK